MKLSENFFCTFKSNSADEESISGNLLVRSGMIKKVGSGIYIFLPLAFKVLKNIENIIREEMYNAGSLELLMPSLIPSSYYEESGRKNNFGSDMFNLNDRYNRDLVLGPTHEELFVEVAKMKIKSYKDMPFNIYQMADKFRDEPRPRFGLIRVREFIMKDAYSFDIDSDSLDTSYQKMYEAYIKIFNRLNLKYAIVKSDTGVMGGLLSEEFQAITDIGEDTIVTCSKCDFSSNKDVLDEKTSKCPKCNSELIYNKGIEVGNIFKLGTKYSEKLNLKYSDKDNNLKPVWMGCYGIGVARILASYIEQHNDCHGMIFDYNIAPYKVCIVVQDITNSNQIEYANELYKKLTEENIEVLLDDRNERIGVKFNDMDLIGIPLRITIGKDFPNQIIELKERTSSNSETINIEETNIINVIKDRIK